MAGQTQIEHQTGSMKGLLLGKYCLISSLPIILILEQSTCTPIYQNRKTCPTQVNTEMIFPTALPKCSLSVHCVGRAYRLETVSMNY